MPTNDNHLPPREPIRLAPDAQGQAALLLVESLIHALKERSILTLGEALDVIETAANVQGDVARAADGDGAAMWESHAILSSIATSLRHDGNGAPPIR